MPTVVLKLFAGQGIDLAKMQMVAIFLSIQVCLMKNAVWLHKNR